jgi:hypothetical protein
MEESARLFKRQATITEENRKFLEERFFFADPAILKIFTFDFLEGSPDRTLTNTFPDIMVLLSPKYLVLVIVSVLIASPLAWLMRHQWLMHFAFRINISWWIFVLAGVAAILIAAVTVCYQVLRVATANPMKSLREK